MQQKTLWILASRIDLQLYPNKQQKIDNCVTYATRKKIPFKFLYVEDIQLDTMKLKVDFPKKDDFVLHVTKSSSNPEKTAYILAFFESLGIRMINSPGAVTQMGDKWLTNSILSHADIPVPPTKLVSVSDPVLPEFYSNVNFPVVAKVLNGSLGEGVFWVETIEMLEDLITFVRSQSPVKKYILVQEAIVSSKGTDIRVIVLNGTVLGAIKRSNNGTSFKANIRQGGVATFYPVDDKLKVLSQKITSTLSVGFAGIDFLIDEHGNYYVTEVNAYPGFKGFESIHTNIDLAEELIKAFLQ